MALEKNFLFRFRFQMFKTILNTNDLASKKTKTKKSFSNFLNKFLIELIYLNPKKLSPFILVLKPRILLTYLKASTSKIKIYSKLLPSLCWEFSYEHMKHLRILAFKDIHKTTICIVFISLKGKQYSCNSFLYNRISIPSTCHLFTNIFSKSIKIDTHSYG